MLNRLFAVASSALLLSACASTGGARGAFDQVPLFGADGKAHFAFYYACSGTNDLENDLCDTAGRDFSSWADEHRVPAKRVTKDDFDEKSGVAAAKLVSRDKDLPYRVYVRFIPIAEASVQWSLSNDVKGGYSPPKAGYAADAFVYGVAESKVVAQTHLSNKTTAKDKADPTPYIHDGAAAVLAALSPSSTPQH